MDINKLYGVVALIAALSMASERLVEIVKGLVPWLSLEKKDDPVAEGRRRAALQLLAVGAGIITALLAQTAVQDLLPIVVEKPGVYVALGFAVSGGSGFWNALLVYLTKVKEIKVVEAAR